MSEAPDKPEDQPSGEPQPDEEERRPLREVSEDELKEILEAHGKWLESGGKEGRRAELRATDLSGVDLRNANLSRADLQEADLSKAALDEANLSEATVFDANLTKAALHTADLTGADLRGANLQEARLIQTKLRETQLQGAKLATAVGLLSSQFAGSDVSGATLPQDIAKFEGLRFVEETSRITRPMFIGMLAGCVYSWLTIATTEDARLLTNSASSPLPIIQTEIPIAGFYWAASLILLTLYVYLHLYLQRLWVGLADLPAIFPDGKTLGEKAYPWLLNGLVRAHFRRLKYNRPPLSRVQNFVSIVIAWWVVPLTLLLLWGRYLPRHEWVGTGLHIVLLVVSTWFGLVSYRLARAALRGNKPKPFRWKKPWRESRVYLGTTALAIGAIFVLISFGAIEGKPRHLFRLHSGPPLLAGVWTWVPYGFERLGYRTFANLRDAEVSTKPENWRGEEKDIPLVKGASLKGSDLRYADATRAFLVKAALWGADLQGASLEGANLQGANLTLANLQGANLEGANLQGANFRARGLTQKQLDDTCGDAKTKLPPNLSVKPCPKESK